MITAQAIITRLIFIILDLLFTLRLILYSQITAYTLIAVAILSIDSRLVANKRLVLLSYNHHHFSPYQGRVHMKFSDAAGKSIEMILAGLDTSLHGLSAREAKKRLLMHGLNEPESYRVELVTILVKQCKSPFAILLFLAALVSIIIGETNNAIIIMIFSGINIVLGFFHEAKAHKAAALLKQKIPSRTVVIRSGKSVEIEKKSLVPGDIVTLKQGDIVPADIRIAQMTNLLVDESMLSGESTHAVKSVAPIEQVKDSVFKARNILFAGSAIISGEALGVVIAIGKDTVLGEIATFIGTLSPDSNYNKKLTSLYRGILKIVFISILIVFVAHIVIKGRIDLFEFMVFMIALLVGIVPEALPTVATLALSLGALKLAQKHVIVKRLAAIEDLGDIEILCTDKTGTLTENSPSLAHIIADDQQKCLLFGLLCSPYAAKTVFDRALGKSITPVLEQAIKDFTLVSESPFDVFKMSSSVIVKHRSGTYFLITKGAPDKLLKELGNSPAQAIEQALQAEEAAGHRTLAVTYKESPTQQFDQDAVWLGFFSFNDPLKKQSKQAIEGAEKLGLKIKILTGDSKIVAEAVGRELGFISGEGASITGDELAELSAVEFQGACEKYSIFARVSPKIKYNIIKELQKKYNVGFLGDGVNDAPALKIAHVGITVKEAVDVAREASDIILLRNDFMVLVEGIKYGRMIFANINKFIVCTLISNFGNCYSMAIVSLLLPFIPILPIQILLVNILSNFPLMAMATDSVDSDALKMPQHFTIAQLVPFILVLALVSSLFDFAFFGIFFKTVNKEVLRTLWFVMSIFTEIILIFSLRTKHFFAFAKAPSFWLIATALFTSVMTLVLPITSIGSSYFGLTYTMEWMTVGILFALTLGYFAVTEGVKLLFFAQSSRQKGVDFRS